MLGIEWTYRFHSNYREHGMLVGGGGKPKSIRTKGAREAQSAIQGGGVLMKLSTEMEHRGRVYVAAVVTTYGVFHVTKEVHAKLKVMERFPYQCVARGCEGCLVCEVRK